MQTMKSASSTPRTQRILEADPGRPGEHRARRGHLGSPQGAQGPLFPESTGSSRRTCSRGTCFRAFLHPLLASRAPSHPSLRPHGFHGAHPAGATFQRGNVRHDLTSPRRSPVRATDSPSCPLRPRGLPHQPPSPAMSAVRPSAEATAGEPRAAAHTCLRGRALRPAPGPQEETGMGTSGWPKVPQPGRGGCDAPWPEAGPFPRPLAPHPGHPEPDHVPHRLPPPAPAHPVTGLTPPHSLPGLNHTQPLPQPGVSVRTVIMHVDKQLKGSPCARALL